MLSGMSLPTFCRRLCEGPGYEYLEIAKNAGYTHLTLGTPVVLADGISGNDSIKVKAGELLGEISIASAIHDARSMVVLTHVKGHIQAVLGGAIKKPVHGRGVLCAAERHLAAWQRQDALSYG